MVDYTDTLTINLVFSLPTVPLFPSLTLYPALDLYPGSDELPMPETLQVDEIDKLISIVSSLNESDTQTHNNLNNLIPVISNHSIYEAFGVNEIDTYIIPIPTITVSHTDYQTHSDILKLIEMMVGDESNVLYPALDLYPSLILYPGDYGAISYQTMNERLKSIDLISTINVNDYQTNYELGKDISIISVFNSTDYHANYELFKLVDILQSITQTDIMNMLDLHTILSSLVPSENDTTTFSDINTDINIISTFDSIDAQSFYDRLKQINMISTFNGYLTVPYEHINLVVKFEKPKVSVTVLGKPKLLITNL